MLRYLAPPIASTSSKKMMQVFLDRARENNSRTMRAPNGQHDRWSGGGQEERDKEKGRERGIEKREREREVCAGSCSPSPTYLCTSSLPITRMNVASARLATALADRVFPVPAE